MYISIKIQLMIMIYTTEQIGKNIGIWMVLNTKIRIYILMQEFSEIIPQIRDINLIFNLLITHRHNFYNTYRILNKIITSK
jgi:hypothetical protein